jgi:hypothetical protein
MDVIHIHKYMRRLRAKVNLYALEIESGQGYDIDRSLFERLVEDRNAPTCVLNRQYRMRPQISEIVRRSIYPTLQDAPKTREYPLVRGMCDCLFFWDHRVDEDGVRKQGRVEEGGGMSDMSKSNTYEIDCVLALVK